MAATRFEHGAKPGDLIQIFRRGETYQHWAVYICGDEVVHLTNPDGDSSSSGSMSLALSSGVAHVMRHNIWKVVGGDRFEINNLLDDEYEPRECDVIVKEACGMVGSKQKYNLLSLNCEHFATELRYGQPESEQVRQAATVVTTVLGNLVTLGAMALINSFFKEGKEERKARKRRIKRR